MATKQLLPNQCTPLHFLYGKDDCCLCKARSEAVKPSDQLILERLRQLLEQDELAVRRFWNEYFPERELERFANDNGFSFD